MKVSQLELLNKRHSCLSLETVISGYGSWNDWTSYHQGGTSLRTKPTSWGYGTVDEGESRTSWRAIIKLINLPALGMPYLWISYKIPHFLLTKLLEFGSPFFAVKSTLISTAGDGIHSVFSFRTLKAVFHCIPVSTATDYWSNIANLFLISLWIIWFSSCWELLYCLPLFPE